MEKMTKNAPKRLRGRPASTKGDVADSTVEQSGGQILIKKYPNRRLYNTTTSAYIVLDDIIDLVKSGANFTIEDTKTGEDITRSILNQIIFEQEIKPNDFHFSLDVQKQLISMYGDAYGKMMPDYLEESMSLFAAEREKMRSTVESIAGQNAKAMMAYTQNLARQNMEIFRRSMNLFNGAYGDTWTEQSDTEGGERKSELDAIQEQIDALQERLKSLK